MATHYTNGDRILQAVLADPKLAELGEYTPTICSPDLSCSRKWRSWWWACRIPP